LAGVAQACPNCKNAIAENAAGGTGGDIARGFYYSILFMMSMPYILLGSLGCLAYVSIRRAKVQQESDAASNASDDANAR